MLKKFNCHLSIAITRMCSLRSKLKSYLTLRERLMPLNWKRERSHRLDLFTHSQRMSCVYYANTWTSTWREDGFESLSPLQARPFYLCRRRMEVYVYASTIGGLTALLLKTAIRYL